MVETYRTPLPEHALAEIKKDKKQRAFWEAWQAVGDAKLDASDAFAQVVDAEQAYTDCRGVALTAARPLIDGCGCGRHLQRVRSARDHYEAQRPKVSDAIEKFKGRK